MTLSDELRKEAECSYSEGFENIAALCDRAADELDRLQSFYDGRSEILDGYQRANDDLVCSLLEKDRHIDALNKRVAELEENIRHPQCPECGSKDTSVGDVRCASCEHWFDIEEGI